jgi:hypothetical protein
VNDELGRPRKEAVMVNSTIAKGLRQKMMNLCNLAGLEAENQTRDLSNKKQKCQPLHWHSATIL